jgi:DNA polymerase III subunit delta'
MKFLPKTGFGKNLGEAKGVNMFFRDIHGMHDTKRQLVGSVENNHLAHALLFSGKEGSANLALALAFATYVNCTDKKDGDGCGTCPSCQKNKKFVHPDLHFVFPICSTKEITGQNVISVNYLKDWRNFLINNPYGSSTDWNLCFGGDNKQLNISKEESRQIIKNLALKTFEGQFKVMLIWLPEFMHPYAANAILKILEEPSPKTLFLLVSQKSEDLLPTIISRTQPFYIRPFNDQEISEILSEQFKADESKANHIAQLSEGNLNWAKKLLDEVEDNSHKMFRDWMRLCFVNDFTKLVAWTEMFQKLNRLGQRTMLQYGLHIMRETLLEHTGNNNLSKLNGEEKEFVGKFSKVILPDMIAKVSEQLNTAIFHLERNANAKIVFLDLSLIICGIMKSHN